MPEVRRKNDSKGPDIEVLVITYDGLLEPAGNAHVLPYVEAITREGVRLRVLSFEKAEDVNDASRMQKTRARLEAAGIDWTPLRHRRLRVFGMIVEVVSGALAAARMTRARSLHIVHARSYVAGLIGYLVKRTSGARFVFDMQGFWPEERVEMGMFRSDGLLYRASKLGERLVLAAADHVVVLTESAKAIVRDREATARIVSPRNAKETPVTVIPLSVDLAQARPRRRAHELATEHGLERALVIGNIGAVTQRYMLTEMFRFAFHVKAHRPEIKFVYLTRDRASNLRATAREAGLRDEDVLVRSVDPDDLPRWLSLFRIGIFFLRPSYAAKGSSYHELAEFLACGVPVVTNTGVGDIDVILRDDRSRVLVTGLTESDLAAAARSSLPLLEGDGVPDEVRETCRFTAEKNVSLATGVDRFARIYRDLAAPAPAEPSASVAVEVG